jgi:L-asparaginase
MMESKVKRRVYIIGTGGSISCIGRSRIDYVNYSDDDKHLTVPEMLARIPEAGEFAEMRCEQFSNVYGGGLAPSDWLALARRINDILRQDADAAGVVITHGTSTLEETAYFLNLTVKDRRPVVVTGAMRPPSSLSTDADLNLLDSIRVAAEPASAGRGVLVALNNEIHAAREVAKTSSSRLHTFRSQEFGCLGYADVDQRIVYYRMPVKAHTFATEFDPAAIDMLPRVDVAYAYTGADGVAIDAFANAGARGIVSAGLGSGNVPRAFMDALIAARGRGIAIVMATHAGSGRARRSERMAERGFVAADNLAPKKARILLMLALTASADPAEIQRMMFQY